MPTPTKKRVDETVKVLKDPANKFDLRLKRLGYRSVAHAIARAEMYVEVLEKFQDEKADARKRRDNAYDRYLRQIKRIEKDLRAKFSDLPEKIQMSSLFKRDDEPNRLKSQPTGPEAAEKPDYVRDVLIHKIGPKGEPYTRYEKKPGCNLNIRDYGAASRDFHHAKNKIKRIFGHGDKPVEIAVEKFCMDMKDLYKEKGIPFGSNGYKLIADLITFFCLSKQPPTSQAIRKRFERSSNL
jgi:hypothetical protein